MKFETFSCSKIVLPVVEIIAPKPKKNHRLQPNATCVKHKNLCCRRRRPLKILLILVGSLTLYWAAGLWGDTGDFGLLPLSKTTRCLVSFFLPTFQVGSKTLVEPKYLPSCRRLPMSPNHWWAEFVRQQTKSHSWSRNWQSGVSMPPPQPNCTWPYFLHETDNTNKRIKVCQYIYQSRCSVSGITDVFRIYVVVHRQVRAIWRCTVSA